MHTTGNLSGYAVMCLPPFPHMASLNRHGWACKTKAQPPCVTQPHHYEQDFFALFVWFQCQHTGKGQHHVTALQTTGRGVKRRSTKKPTKEPLRCVASWVVEAILQWIESRCACQAALLKTTSDLWDGHCAGTADIPYMHTYTCTSC